jgi:formate-dependent nitrite reductase cytochrome c552 subunit
MPNKTGPALDELDDQIIDLVGNHVRRRKAEYEKVAIKLKNKLRDDVVRYSEALDARKINREDYEMLIRGRYAQLKIELLEQASVSRAKFDLITSDVVRLVIKTGIDAAKES